MARRLVNHSACESAGRERLGLIDFFFTFIFIICFLAFVILIFICNFFVIIAFVFFLICDITSFNSLFPFMTAPRIPFRCTDKDSYVVLSTT